MLSMPQRQQLAAALKQLRDRLRPYNLSLLKELPTELQAEVRSQKLLGAITSSGIEHVNKIIDRLTWASHYLTDPNFPANMTTASTPKKTPKTADLPPPQSRPLPPVPPPPAVVDDDPTIDFGPFAPRTGS